MTNKGKQRDAGGVVSPDLPRGWSWWSGNRGSDYYTRWFGTNYRMGGPLAGRGSRLGGFEGQVYHDEGGDHHVEISPIVGIDEHDDLITDYPDATGSYDSEQEAIDAVPRLIEKLNDRLGD